MRHFALLIVCGIILAHVLTARAQMSDSLPIHEHYAQNERVLSRRDMEKVLLETPVALVAVDRAKGPRSASNVLGITTWCLSTGISAYQVIGLVDAIEQQRPYSNELDDLVLPLSIGGQLASFLQSRLRARADYLFRKGVIEYNRGLCRRTNAAHTLDHTIRAVGNGWYEQDGVLMSPATLDYVLVEQPAARGLAARGVFYRESGGKALGMGISLLMLAVVAGIDNQPFRGYLVSGSCTTGFGLINLISAAVARKRALRAYNEAEPDAIPCAPPIQRREE